MLRTFAIHLQPLKAGDDSTAVGRMGKPTLPRWSLERDSCPCPKPLIFPPLPGKHPNLFHSSLELAREIPPSRVKERTEQARPLFSGSASLTFKAARARPRPALPRSRLIHPGRSPPSSLRSAPSAASRAMSAARPEPNPLLLLNLKSNLKRMLASHFSHPQRTLLIE